MLPHRGAVGGARSRPAHFAGVRAGGRRAGAARQRLALRVFALHTAGCRPGVDFDPARSGPRPALGPPPAFFCSPPPPQPARPARDGDSGQGQTRGKEGREKGGKGASRERRKEGKE